MVNEEAVMEVVNEWRRNRTPDAGTLSAFEIACRILGVMQPVDPGEVEPTAFNVAAVVRALAASRRVRATTNGQAVLD